jgi:cyanophycin synthetase
MITQVLVSKAWRLSRYLAVREMKAQLAFDALRRRYYKDLWRRTAAEIGAQHEEWGYGIDRITKGTTQTFVRSAVMMFDTGLMHHVIGNKALTLSLLQERGCPVADYLCYDAGSIAAAEAFLAAAGGTAVVKPLSGTGGGAGVTPGVASPAALRKASRRALRHGSDLLVERHVEGASFRLLYLNGRLIDAVRRDPPTLTGDGRSTIRQLVAAENRRRLTCEPITTLFPLTIDGDCLAVLDAQGLSPRATLERGRRVAVKRSISQNTALETQRLPADSGAIHPSTDRLCARVAQELNLEFVGFDIICQDIASPLTRENGVISELNTMPGLHYHQLLAGPGPSVDVAKMALLEVLASGRGAVRRSEPSPAAGPAA